MWALALCTLILTGIAVQQFAIEPPPEPKLDGLAPRLALLRAADPPYNLWYLGTSRVLRGFDAGRFDAEMNALGCPVRSFNLGFPGLALVEQWWLLKRLRQANIPAPAMVLFEPFPARRETDFKFLLSDRRLYFNRPRQLWPNLLDTLTYPDSNLIANSAAAAGVLAGFAYQQLGIGTLSQALFPQRARRADDCDQCDMDAQGYAGFTREAEIKLAERRRAWKAERREFDTQRARYAAAPDSQANNGPRIALLQRTQEQIRKLGAEPVLAVMPALPHTRHGRGLTDVDATELHGVDTRLNFSDPARYPELFEPALWFDLHHLNRDGAARYAATLARTLCPVIQAKYADRVSVCQPGAHLRAGNCSPSGKPGHDPRGSPLAQH